MLEVEKSNRSFFAGFRRLLQSAGYPSYAAAHAVRCRGLQPQRSAVFFSRECTDNKLIPEKDPVQFRLAHVTTRTIRQCFPVVFVPFGSTVGCLCAREWEVSKVEASLSTSDSHPPAARATATQRGPVCLSCSFLRPEQGTPTGRAGTATAHRRFNVNVYSHHHQSQAPSPGRRGRFRGVPGGWRHVPLVTPAQAPPGDWHFRWNYPASTKLRLSDRTNDDGGPLGPLPSAVCCNSRRAMPRSPAPKQCSFFPANVPTTS